MKKLRECKLFTSFIIILFFTLQNLAYPQELKSLPVNLSKSSIKVNISSKLITTSALLKDFSGNFTKTGPAITDGKIYLSAQSSGVAFEQMPFDKMLLVNGLLQAAAGRVVTFESTSIEQNGASYIINGIGISGQHRNPISLPAQIKKFNSGFQIIADYARTGVLGKKEDAQSALFGTITTTGKINVIFE